MCLKHIYNINENNIKNNLHNIHVIMVVEIY